MILQVFYKNAELYLINLKKINKETEVAESVLKSSLKNKELLKMLSLQALKSMYIVTMQAL